MYDHRLFCGVGRIVDLPGKTVPLSVRMSADDMTALAELDLSDAVTPSDKLRKLVRNAYRRQKGQTDYAEALAIAEEQLSPTLRRVRNYEAKWHVHSDLVVYFLNWLPDALAIVTAGISDPDGKLKRQSLEIFERDIADRVTALLLETLKMALTPATSCYRAATLNEKLPELLELTQLIEPGRHAKGGKNHE